MLLVQEINSMLKNAAYKCLANDECLAKVASADLLVKQALQDAFQPNSGTSMANTMGLNIFGQPDMTPEVGASPYMDQTQHGLGPKAEYSKFAPQQEPDQKKKNDPFPKQ